jgi:hypothetical protein
MGSDGGEADMTVTPPTDMALPSGPDFSGFDLTPIPRDMGPPISSGTFANGVSLNQSSRPAQVFTGDWNGDGKTDLVFLTAYSYAKPSLVLRLGSGTGTFATANTIWTGTQNDLTSDRVWAVKADVNADGKPDFIVSEKGNVTSIIAAAGASTNFTAAPKTGALPGATVMIDAGDLNGDNRADIVFLRTDNSHVIALAGDGAGEYSALLDRAVTGYQRPQALDIDGDGKLDIAIPEGKAVTWMKGDGAGTFAANATLMAISDATITAIQRLAVGDFNGDGLRDIFMVASNSQTTVGYYFVIQPGTGAGTWGAPSTPKPITRYVNPLSLATGDFDGNGALDAAVIVIDQIAQPTDTGMWVSLNSNSGLGNPLKYPINYAVGLNGIAAGLINGDLITDLVTCGNNGPPTPPGQGDAHVYLGQ